MDESMGSKALQNMKKPSVLQIRLSEREEPEELGRRATWRPPSPPVSRVTTSEFCS